MEFKHLSTPKSRATTKLGFVKWKAPTRGYKLNTDGSTFTTAKTNGFGGVIRDREGKWILGFMGNLPQTDNILAEIQVLVVGLKLVRDHILTPIEISVDCQVIIHLLTNDHPMYSHILYDCRELLLQLGMPQLWHDY